jgi:hypothetical protein
LTGTPLTGHYTEIGVTNAFNIGGGGNNNAEYNYTTLQVADDVDWVRGAHQIGFGIDYKHQIARVYNTQYSNGTFSFDGTVTGLSLADLLVGRVGTFTQGAEVHLNEREEFFATYLQDAWRLNAKTTVNAGLRWEPYFPLTNDDKHNALFDLTAFAAGKKSTVFPTAPAGLTYPGDPGYPGSAASHGQLARFDPRVGLVYDPRGQGREVIRAAYGIVHDQPPMFYHFPTSTMPPWGARVVLNNVPFSDPYATYPGGNPFNTVDSLQGKSSAAVFPQFSVYAVQQHDARDAADAALEHDVPEAVRRELVRDRQLLRQQDHAHVDRHGNQPRGVLGDGDDGEHEPAAPPVSAESVGRTVFRLRDASGYERRGTL